MTIPEEPDVAPLFSADVPVEPPSTGEKWVSVDPNSYSNPDTEAPVYTSGPQPVPTEVAGRPEDPPPPPVGSTWAAAAGGPVEAPGSPVDPRLSPGYEPEKGELKIKERRSWKTWQLVVAVLLAALAGMWFNGNAGSPSGIPGGSGGAAGYKLPPRTASGPTTTARSARPAAGGATTTTAPRSATTTTTPSGGSTSTTTGRGAPAGAPTTSSPVAVGPATVLVPATQLTGNWTSPAFTIAGGTWNIGWAFQCVPAPSAAPAFQIFVVSSGGSPGATPAVTSATASGNSVTPLTSTGSQQVMVQTSPSCRWAVKVTGFSG